MCVLVVENVLSAVQFKRPNALVISDQISHKHMAVHRWLGTTSVDKVKKKKRMKVFPHPLHHITLMFFSCSD